MLTRREFIGIGLVAAYAIVVGFDALTLSEGEKEELEMLDLERVEHEHEGSVS